MHKDLPSAVNYQSRELAFLDDELASKIGDLTDKIPTAKARLLSLELVSML